MATKLPPPVSVAAVDGLLKRAGVGVPPVMPGPVRAEIIRGLVAVLMDHAALDEHTRLLQQRVPRSDRRQFLGTGRPDPDLRRAILDGGPATVGNLPDDALGLLVLNPIALYELADAIADDSPVGWRGVSMAVRAIDSAAALAETLPVSLAAGVNGGAPLRKFRVGITADRVGQSGRADDPAQDVGELAVEERGLGLVAVALGGFLRSGSAVRVRWEAASGDTLAEAVAGPAGRLRLQSSVRDRAKADDRLVLSGNILGATGAWPLRWAVEFE